MLPTTPIDLPFDPAAALLRPQLPPGVAATAEVVGPEPGEAFASLLEASQARLAPSPGLGASTSSQPLFEPVSQPSGEAVESVPAPVPAKAVAERAPAPVAVMPLPGTRLPPSGEMLPSLLPPSIDAPQPEPAETVALPPGATPSLDEEGSPDPNSPESMVAVAILPPGQDTPQAGVPMPATTTSGGPLASAARAIPVAVPATAPLTSLGDRDAVDVLQPQFFAREVPPPQAAKPNHLPAANPLPPDDGVMTAGLRVLPPNPEASVVRRSAKADGAAAPLAVAAMPVSSLASPPAPAPLPGAAAPASAPAPSPAMVPEAGAAQGASLAAQPAGMEAAIEQLAGLRDAARAARPEVTLRHGEFGAVSLRVEASAAVPGEWRAVVASRDPGFVPAVQAALAERAIAAAGEAASSGGLSSGANGSGSGPGQGTYGSSPGSQQGSSQPYSPQGQGERRHAAAKLPDQPAEAARRADDPAGGLFA